MGGDIWSLQVSPLCSKSVSFAVTVIYLVSLKMEQNSGFPHLLVANTDSKKKFTLYWFWESVCAKISHKAYYLPLLRARCSDSLFLFFHVCVKKKRGRDREEEGVERKKFISPSTHKIGTNTRER